MLTSGLIVVNIDPLQLQIGISMIGTGGVNTVLVGGDFPELKLKLQIIIIYEIIVISNASIYEFRCKLITSFL